MILNVILLVFGFFLLTKGAHFFLDGAVSLSKKLKIPALIIGLTVVAFGTSAPELFISVISSIKGSSEITLGNIVGSNISNVLLILGASALIYPLKTHSKVIIREIPFMFLTALALWFIADDAIFGGGSESIISRGDSYVLLLLFSIFVYYLVSEAIKSKNDKEIQKEFEKIEGVREYSKASVITFSILGGILMLGFGGKLVVDSAIFIATSIGVSETLIGLTIVAVGSSLPELVTTILAVKKKESDVAIGNIVGSCVFNTIFVLGISGAITPLVFNSMLRVDILVFIFSAVVLFVATVTDKKITRPEGFFLFLSYLAYLIFVILRG